MFAEERFQVGVIFTKNFLNRLREFEKVFGVESMTKDRKGVDGTLGFSNHVVDVFHF